MFNQKHFLCVVHMLELIKLKTQFLIVVRKENLYGNQPIIGKLHLYLQLTCLTQ